MCEEGKRERERERQDMDRQLLERGSSAMVLVADAALLWHWLGVGQGGPCSTLVSGQWR